MRPDAWRWLFALCLVVMAPCVWASASTPVAACSADSISLAQSARLFRDDASNMTRKQVMQLPNAAFTAIDSGRYRGNGKGVWWLRFKLRNASLQFCERWLVIAPARVADVRVYVPGDTGWKRMVGGTRYPFRKWALPERQPVFPVALEPGVTTVLAQVINRGEALSFTPHLWSPQAFLQRANKQSLTDGLLGGSVMLLVLVSLVLSFLYRRPPLLYMALATAFYVIHVALFKNYLFVYVWPDSHALNLWARFFFINMHLATLFAYIYTVVNIARLRRWARLFYYWAPGGFVLLALFGSFAPKLAVASLLIIGLYEFLIWTLAGLVIYKLLRGRDRRWFPPLLMAAVCFQSVVVLGQLVGLDAKLWGPLHIATPMTVALGVFLLGTLFSQARKSRRAELHARLTLDKQRTTEAERLERTVAQRTGELNRALKTRRQLLGRISHDLRSPLISMLDGMHLWRTGDTHHDYPRLIEQRAQQQLDMVDELLEFSRTESAEMQPRPVAGYLHAFLNEVADQSSATAARRGNRLQRAFADDLPTVISADFHYLRRVLINLLDNASKFTRRGTIRFSVQTQPGAAIGMARLHFIIDDNGPGIAPASRERLLQPFVRGANPSARPGHGLGLAIVTQLLERMDADLHIDSAPGGGSRFHFVLDVACAAENEIEPVLKEGSSIDIDGADRVILVVDDEPMQRELVCDLLDGYGFDSIAAAGGHAALDIMRTRRVDLVLTDQYMGDLSGWHLLQAVREQCPDVPVLLYSSSPPQAPAGMTAQPAFDAALLKPADSATLLRHIVSLLDDASVTTASVG